MLIAKQMELRSNIKKFFDIAYDGEVVIVPRKQDRNVVIISENEYNRLSRAARLSSYARSVSPLKDKHINDSTADNLMNHNLKKLQQIREMKDNWNGNGAPALPASLIDKVEDLIGDLIIQPEVFPTALGTIQLEYDNSRRDHIEIEIGNSEQCEVFMVKYNGEESYETIPAFIEDINERIGEFYG